MSRHLNPPAIVQSEITEAEVVNRWDLATGREERAEKTLAESRLEKGRILVAARKLYPSRGPKAKGWGELLRRLRIDERTARRYMELAGYVDTEVSDKVSETVPTYAEAGIFKPKADPSKHPPPGLSRKRIPSRSRNRPVRFPSVRGSVPLPGPAPKLSPSRPIWTVSPFPSLTTRA